ncbi:MAG TPA: magnesium transporter [Gemmataceae bacterium]|nr:magnesium transporter [Gemmataceae bacterium]
MAATLTGQALNDPVTRHMRRDFTQLRVDQTVDQALATLRQSQPQGRIIYLYVTDADDRLQGVVPTRRILLSQPDATIESLMVKPVVSISHNATVLEACEFFTMHRLLAFPVVDDERRMLGLVDVDLYTEELTDIDRREGNDELFQLIGVHVTTAQQANPLLSFRQRFPWLICNIVAGVLAALLAGIYEHELQKVVALALFIPVVLALAESVSIQSVSLTLQFLRGQQPTWAAMAPRATSELLAGLLLGSACGLLLATVALIWLGSVSLSLCIFGGIAGGVTAAAVIGLSLPYILHLLERDPRVAAGPVALACADMVTLLIYFNLARWLLA